MAMTILPGQAEGSATPTPPNHRHRPASRRKLMVAAVAAVAVLAGTGWYLTRSSGSTGTTPVTPVSHPVAPAKPASHRVALPAHGRVSKAALTAVATPAFSAMVSTLAGWQQQGRLHVNAQHRPGGFDRKLGSCAQIAFHPSLNATSANYVREPFKAQGEIDAYATPGAAVADFSGIFRAAASGCLNSAFAKGLRHGKLGGALATSKVTVAHLRGFRHAGFMRLVAGYVVNGREIPVEIDAVAMVLGRTQVSFSVTSALTHLGRAQEVATLRAMVKALRPTLA